jgi:hypothetical protein
MDKLFAIINIASAIASILGFILAYRYDNIVSNFRRIAAAGFGLFLLLAAYTLLIPSNWFEVSAGAKIQRYSSTTDDSGLLIQKDNLSVRGVGTRLTVEFPAPYKKPPQVKILHLGNSENAEDVPNIVEIQNTHFIVNGHWTVVGVNKGDDALLFSDRVKSYRWIAQGVPLLEERSK